MIWIYDNAIVSDLKESFDTDNVQQPVVSIVPPEEIISIAAQVQDDKLHFPIIALSRDSSIDIDGSRSNFSMRHQGVATVFDNKTNNLYYEKVMPLKLSYNLICMSTNTADIDELIRELLFKYSSQYFLTVQIPYESKRNVRIGINIDPDETIQWQSSTSDYLQGGKLHSAQITLKVDGAVLVNYTPVKLKRFDSEIGIDQKGVENVIRKSSYGNDEI